ncbi:MAG TPA: YihY/virulence factor BrkB family protein [Noviherbaspirillum sp.]|uniref:YihY/virulence factor BrkB family protein n=1 Tax=Noviherbaspirillum sp. TaxID=1926288 RepID=UPI002D32E4BE|nr:YihY/virulence factor BrkB family protein [Noviherbaspirillum sp.]HYD95935.1 YihY/virulence factor BrkB family protein [Noviherbaspirillum sp.]
MMGLHGMKPFKLVKDAVKDFLDDDMTTYASALAYQVFFSLFPFIIFLIALLGFLNMSSFFDWVRQHAELMLPPAAAEPVNKVISDLQQQKGGLMSIGVIIALWSASSAVRATMNALNVAYDVKEGRPAWKLYPLSIVYTIGIAAMLVAAGLLLTVGPQAMEWLANQVGFGQFFVTLWAWLRWPVAFLLLTLAVAVIYYVAPDVEQDFSFITPGALLAVIVWIAASLGFNYYVSNFADYNATYGSIGAIIILLLYFFISAAVLLFGAEINAVIEHYSPEGKSHGEKAMP